MPSSTGTCSRAAGLTSGTGEGVVKLLHHFLQTCACVLGRAEQVVLAWKADPDRCIEAAMKSFANIPTTAYVLHEAMLSDLATFSAYYIMKIANLDFIYYSCKFKDLRKMGKVGKKEKWGKMSARNI